MCKQIFSPVAEILLIETPIGNLDVVKTFTVSVPLTVIETELPIPAKGDRTTCFSPAGILLKHSTTW